MKKFSLLSIALMGGENSVQSITRFLTGILKRERDKEVKKKRVTHTADRKR